MKKNIRKIIASVITAALILSLPGCGSLNNAGAETPAEPEAESPAEPTAEAPAAKEAEAPAVQEAEALKEPAGDVAPSETAEDKAEESGNVSEETAEAKAEETEIQVFIAASLSNVMEKVAAAYNEKHPEVKISFNADSSGTLLTQIEEGYACDVFFSAAKKQMDTLENEDKLLVDGTRKDVVNNQVCVITLQDSGTAVTGLKDIGKASSIALADGSVPVGRYTRQAMVNAGMLKEVEDVSKITTKEISDQLGGVEISEQSNVSKVLAAVTEGSSEVGTTYFSDTYGFEDKVKILEKIPYDLTGNVIYPIAQVKNDEADETEKAAALDFVKFVTSDEAKAIFESCYFDTDV